MKKTDIKNFVQTLKNTYPDATCSLDFKTPFQLVVAVMLSAQCTDERVNKTTPALFERCKTIQDFADIDINELNLQKDEVEDVKYFPCDEIIGKINDNYNGLTEKTVSWNILKRLLESEIISQLK